MIDNWKLILTDTLYFWYLIFLIPDISDTQYISDISDMVLDISDIHISDTRYFWYPIFIIANINDTQYIWYFWYMNSFQMRNRGHSYAAGDIFIFVLMTKY